MEILQLRYSQCTEQQTSQCRALTFDNGYMKELLTREQRLAKQEQVPMGWIFLAQDINVLGWCFLGNGLRCSAQHMHVYVHPQWRFQGIGRQLVNHARLLAPETTVFPHDQGSVSFYCNVGLAEQVDVRDVVSRSARDYAAQQRFQAIADRYETGAQGHTSSVEQPLRAW